MPKQPCKLRIGETMVNQGLISHDQLEIALREQKNTHLMLGQIMMQLGFVTEAVMRDLLAQMLDTQSIDISQVVADQEALAMIPQEFARRHRLLPIVYRQETQVFVVAMANASDVIAIDHLRSRLPRHILLETLIASEKQLEEYIDKFYGFELSIDGILKEIETGKVDPQSVMHDTNGYEQPMVRLVNAMLIDAVKQGASDIHFEPEPAFLRIRYRIDGVLQQIRVLHKQYWSGLAVRLKIISGLDITEIRSPQDGRIHTHLCGRPVDFRVSTHPTIHGENIVLRVLDRERSVISLENMGVRSEMQQQLQSILTRPEGLIIITGPTGSGKTTTLYSMLSSLNRPQVNIMTLEDPVEFPLNMLRQTSVGEGNKIDFANGIRSILRQDPDIILVGEIRDEDTAKMAFRAAMTGHQVFATLHTHSVFGVIPRLKDLNISPDIMTGNIIGILAQRLVRVLCPACKSPTIPSEQECTMLSIAHTNPAPIYHAVGCKTCRLTGFTGRMAIMELLTIDAEINALIACNASLAEIEVKAREKGFMTMAQDGIRLIREGYTSTSELMRVIDMTGTFIPRITT